MNKKTIEKELSAMRGWDADGNRALRLRTYAKSLGYTRDVTGDACQGDKVMFARAVFTGSRRKPRFAGIEIVTGEIVNDSYGQGKQQHTFTIKTGSEKMLIKGRNLYRIATFAKPREEQARAVALNDKHTRGEQARERKQIRKDFAEKFLIEL